ncbi:hypothetical protein [Chitinophaga filiformis]|uniref:Uncharacterized protein n=1 Tax=Chitinophaga filiformis TaxID=104663 RepID=A0A1G7HMU9_CHIFI|nr:hypothetical protein [Chitinophaga filiformis]SDF01733.1 hypothetical protein SAMN04488121_101534 [Chitinophaga filiformis]
MKKNKTSRHKLKRLRGHSSERLHNDPSFENVRKNWQDFTTAARSAKLLRTVMENIMEPVHDRSRQWRLTKAMSQVLRSDKSNPRGECKPADGDLKLLINVELNTGIPFHEIFPETLVHFRIDKKKVKMNLWPIIQESPEPHPLAATATDLEIRLAVANINFSQQSFNIKWASSGMLPFSDPGIENKQLTVKLDKGSKLPLFIFLAINFYNEGFKERINAIKLVDVYTAEDDCEDSESTPQKKEEQL